MAIPSAVDANVVEYVSKAIALSYGWRWVFWGLAIAYTVFVSIVAIQIPQDTRQQSNLNLSIVYKSMVVLLSRLSILAIYGAGFTLLWRVN
jgi:MFS transporter, YNFM family, putative membrane transport protein